MTPLGAHRCGSKARITAIPWPQKWHARERAIAFIHRCKVATQDVAEASRRAAQPKG
jgi:hypothetical protein